jgi:hypothetical protein
VTGQDISDRIAICEVKARYCRFLDTKQWDAWGDLFTDDFVLDTSEASGPPPITGRDTAVKMVRQAIETARTAHHVHSPEIAIAGETASAIWAMQDRVIFDGGHGLMGYGHYAETYEKSGGRWRIASSKLTRLLIDLTTEADVPIAAAGARA